MTEKLKKVFHFNESDVLMNQKGLVSESQLELISRYRRMNKFFGRMAFIVLFLSLSAISGIALYNIGIDVENNPGPLVAYAIFIAVGTLLYIVSAMIGKLRSDLRSGKISVVEGFAEKKHKKMPRQLGTAYYLTISGIKFQLDERAKYVAIEPGTYYRIYFIKHFPNIILSIIKLPVLR